MDRSYLLSDSTRLHQLQEIAKTPLPSVPLQSLSSVEYLEKYVLQQLVPAMQATAKHRPSNAVEFFSYFLLSQRDRVIKREGEEAAQ